MRRHVGIIVVMFAFFLQTFGLASRPLMPVHEDDARVMLCTGNGVKLVPWSDLGIDVEDKQLYAAMTHASCLCAFCLLAHHVAMASPMVYVPAVDLATHAPQAPPPEQLVTEGFRYVPQGRAPPSYV